MIKKLCILICVITSIFCISFSAFAEGVSEPSETTEEIVTEIEENNTEGSETITEPEISPTTEQNETDNTEGSEIVINDYSLILDEININLLKLHNAVFANSVLLSALLIVLILFKR